MSEISQSLIEAAPRHEDDPEALSEDQLWQLYDEEEVKRFMSLFSAYVTEVRLSATATTESTADISTGRGSPDRPPLHPRPTDPSLSGHIAYNYVLPYLPSAAVMPTFTLKRFSLTAQRLYLALFPPYQASFSGLAQLALWQNHRRSLRYCIMFWFLWFHDLLLPALVFWIAFGLLRRRISTQPTLKELQERRQETARALNFGEAVQQQLSARTLGPIEMWRLFKLYKSGEKVRTDEEETLKRGLLFVLNELADFHERIKSIFAWRRPDVSRRYLLILIVVGFGTLVLPAQYIAKLVYGFGGILFWHVTPVIAALPPADRTRASLLFRDAPTDAEHAMELIAKRISTGQDVGTVSSGSRRTSNASASTINLASTSRAAQSFEDDGINWKKWGDRVARGKAFLDEGRQLFSTHLPQNLTSGETADMRPSIRRPGTGDTHTFLAQYASCPGLITLTPSTLFFTSLTESQARLVMPRNRLQGVRRSGIMKGISITWSLEESMGGEERVEKFHWVGNRDELFARLVGSSDGGRWVRV